jgi:hypothetical protein
MRYILIALLVTINAYAISPFSLEGFKEANVIVLDKDKVLTKETKKKILTTLKKELKTIGIKTKTDNFSNLLIKISSIKVKKTYIVNLSLFIVEDIIPSRDKSLEGMGITYKKDDIFETTKNDLQTDIYESAIEYLLFDFIEQYKEENN